MITPQFLLDIRPELIVDLFAGGGGMSIAAAALISSNYQSNPKRSINKAV